MSTIIHPKKSLSVTTRMVNLSPYELFLEQVRGVSENIRVVNKGLTYIPPQFGGLKGQLVGLNDQPVVQMVDFENNT